MRRGEQRPMAGSQPARPQAGMEEPPATFDAPRRKRSRIHLIFAISLIGLAVGAYAFWPAGASDQVSRQDLDRMTASWNEAARDRVSLPAVAAADLKAALATTGLPEKQQSELETSTHNGSVSLVWLTVWDTMAEDGDIAAFESDGLRITVPLLKRQTRIAVPRPAGGVINLIGVKDGGGGGVTVGVMSDGREVLVPPLSEGEVVGIPVR